MIEDLFTGITADETLQLFDDLNEDEIAALFPDESELLESIERLFEQAAATE